MDRFDLPARRGHQFDPQTGRLYHSDGVAVTALFPWPLVVAYQKLGPDAGWKAWRPIVRVPPAEFVEGPDTEAVQAYWRLVPPRVLEVIRPFPDRHWEMLGWMARTGDEAQDLAVGNPSLAYALTCYRQFRAQRGQKAPPFPPPLLVRQKQREILGWLGFPRLESVRKILQKIPHAAINLTRLLQLRRPLGNTDVRQRLAHAPRINTELLWMAGDTTILRVAPRLIAELGTEAYDRASAPVSALLRDTLRMWPMVLIDEPPPVFRSLERMRETHDRLARGVTRIAAAGPDAALPDAPLPGTDAIVPLQTTVELVREAEAQHNCVASYAKMVQGGRMAIYRVLEPERATLSIVRGARGWRLDQLAGPCNRPVRPETREAIRAWLETHRARRRLRRRATPLLD